MSSEVVRKFPICTSHQTHFFRSVSGFNTNESGFMYKGRATFLSNIIRLSHIASSLFAKSIARRPPNIPTAVVGKLDTLFPNFCIFFPLCIELLQ